MQHGLERRFGQSVHALPHAGYEQCLRPVALDQGGQALTCLLAHYSEDIRQPHVRSTALWRVSSVAQAHQAASGPDSARNISDNNCPMRSRLCLAHVNPGFDPLPLWLAVQGELDHVRPFAGGMLSGTTH